MKLLSMSGFVPEHICDTVRFTHYSGNRNISHYCGYISDFISQVMDDSSIDGAVFPHTCDSSRIIKSYMSESGKFMYQLNVPIRNDESAVSFFAESIKDYQRHIEQHYGITITPTQIAERSEMVNKRNAEIKNAYDGLGSFSFADYIEAIHHTLRQPLAEQKFTVESRAECHAGKKVFLVGSFLSNINIARKLEAFGLTVVGDNFPESGRLASRKPISLTADNVYHEIAKSILHNRLSPTQNNFAMLMAQDLAEIKRKEAQAIIFISQKYCEPYDYLYSIYKKMMDEAGIPILKLTLTNSEDNQKAELLLETFADTI